MKKSLLLLVFVACTLMASAMNGPVKTFDLQKVGLENQVNALDPDVACILCSECQKITVCFIASNCDRAGAGLTNVLTDLGCVAGE